MKKSAVVLPLMLSLNLWATDSAIEVNTFNEAFENGKVSGQWRTFYVDRAWDGSIGETQADRNGLATGGHLKFVTDPSKDLKLGIRFDTTMAIGGLNKPNDPERSPTLFGNTSDGYSGYSILNEAYLEYKFNDFTFKGGRQLLNTPLAGTDDARMIPNSFEAYTVSNSTLIPSTTVIAGHVTKFSAGTFGNVYDGGALAVHSGYSAVGGDVYNTKFVNMGEYAIGEETAGVSVLALVSKPVDGLSVKFFDYYAHDLLNAIYVDADYKMNMDGMTPFGAVQIINESKVGDKINHDVKGQYIGLKAGLTTAGMTVYGAYSMTGSDENTGIITPWGGMPAYTQGMVVRHMFFSNTSAMKVAGKYDLSELGQKGSATLYYTTFDMGENNDYVAGHEWTASEFGFDFIYCPQQIKNLQLRLRGNFPTDFVEKADESNLGWSEYRAIANYNF